MNVNQSKQSTATQFQSNTNTSKLNAASYAEEATKFYQKANTYASISLELRCFSKFVCFGGISGGAASILYSITLAAGAFLTTGVIGLGACLGLGLILYGVSKCLDYFPVRNKATQMFEKLKLSLEEQKKDLEKTQNKKTQEIDNDLIFLQNILDGAVFPGDKENETNRIIRLLGYDEKKFSSSDKEKIKKMIDVMPRKKVSIMSM